MFENGQIQNNFYEENFFDEAQKYENDLEVLTFLTPSAAYVKTVMKLIPFVYWSNSNETMISMTWEYETC